MRLAIRFVLTCGAALLPCSPSVRASEAPSEARATQLAEVRALLKEGDTFAVAERLETPGDPASTSQRYREVVGDLYWHAKDVPGALAVGRFAIHHCLTQALATKDATARRALRVTAQELSFDLASFAWPGWGEKDVRIGPSELAAGLDCARLDLRLVRELDYPPTKFANAHWIVGAQLLAAARLDDARAEFEASRASAREAGDVAKEWMAAGYVALVDVRSKPGDAAATARFEEAVRKLDALEKNDGPFLAAQLRDALRVFTAK